MVIINADSGKLRIALANGSDGKKYLVLGRSNMEADSESYTGKLPGEEISIDVAIEIPTPKRLMDMTCHLAYYTALMKCEVENGEKEESENADNAEE